MFDLSWSHIAILVVVALLVLGPKELPNAIRTGAQLLRTGRKLAGEFRSGMDELLREAELEETRQAITQAMSEGVEKTLTENVDPTGELKAARAVDANTLEFTYQSAARAIAIVSRKPLKLQIDGIEDVPKLTGPVTLLLPRGQHVVTLTTD